jgi:mono/diheme cytochrome c family protein
MKKRSILHTATLFVVLAGVLGLLAGAYFVTAGVSARPQPGKVETFVARMVRGIAIRTRTRGLANPIPVTAEIVAEGRAHFADHCASCHANDGSGNTEMGRGLYPKAPDMRLPGTQNLSDGELYYIIENGVRFTGRPGWSTGTAAGEVSTWHLVHFIRHLPTISPEEIEEMEALNPKSPAEIRQQIEEDRFLQGSDSAPAEPSAPAHDHGDKHE